MDWNRPVKLAVILCCAFALQGCVAAAFPVVAGGVLVGKGDGDEEGPPETTLTEETLAEEASAEDAQTEAPPAAPPPSSAKVETPQRVPQEEPAPPAPQIAVEATMAETGTISTRNAGPNAKPQAPEPSARPIPATTLAQTTIAENAPFEAATRSASPAAAEQSSPVTLFDPLFTYASDPAFGQNVPRESAILANATALEPDRVKCQSGAPSVLIDLDPKDGELFPIDAGSASPALAERLTGLRNRGVSIAWISGSPRDSESLIRAALFRSGLDQLGNDRLLLIGGPDQRKQMLRDHLAQSSCLIAIAGDERSDFHELFDYLLNPADAAELEPLIGDGWFLIPTPLISERRP